MHLRGWTVGIVAALAGVGCSAPSDKPVMSDVRIGHCEYTGPFSKLVECKDYLGAWTTANAEKDCADLKGTYEGGTMCGTEGILGACLFAKDPAQVRQYIVSDNTEKCGSGRTGCETFGGGYWDPAPICGGANDELVVLNNPWTEPRRVCFDPAPGEPAGTSEGGKVCVWETIHGATEEGRSFRDDMDCKKSMGGRPYYAKNPSPRINEADARRDDPEYIAEEQWVISQINAASCVCCHSSVPEFGASLFSVDDARGLANQLTDRGIAQAAGVQSTIPLGGFPAEQNNGFVKSDLEHPTYSAFLSTDPDRMKRFWQREFEHRGLTAEQFKDVPDGMGPLSEQFYFKPAACEAGEGIAADGTITWGKGRARYVYVLPADSRAPTTFPNLDTPSATLWRLDVPASGAPLVSGTVKYGVVPTGLAQKVPATGTAPALESGRTYFLYVTADVMLPITRCLFAAP